MKTPSENLLPEPCQPSESLERIRIKGLLFSGMVCYMAIESSLSNLSDSLFQQYLPSQVLLYSVTLTCLPPRAGVFVPQPLNLGRVVAHW